MTNDVAKAEAGEFQYQLDQLRKAYPMEKNKPAWRSFLSRCRIILEEAEAQVDDVTCPTKLYPTT